MIKNGYIKDNDQSMSFFNAFMKRINEVISWDM